MLVVFWLEFGRYVYGLEIGDVDKEYGVVVVNRCKRTFRACV